MSNQTRINLFYSLNKKVITISAIFFLIVNCVLQYQFSAAFTNPNSNGDENGYIRLVESINEFNLDNFSSYTSQPHTILSYFFNQIFDNTKLSIRFVSLLSSILCLAFIFFYYRKHKFISIIEDNKWLNNLIIFNVLFATYYILEQQFIGSSDALSVAFGLPAFLLLTEMVLYNKNHNPLVVGLLCALSFTTRPTFLMIILAFLIVTVLFYFKKVFSRKIIVTGLFFIFFTGLINYNPILNSGKIMLDVKEVPKESGTSWFEMNYLMAKKWDAGEIPNTQWLSHVDVIEFKKQNPNFVFPKNHFDILINDTGLYFRQMLRMMSISLYSSFRYLYFLFPFLIFFFFLKSKKVERKTVKEVYFIVSFYFLVMLLFMAVAFKLMEFRWMQIPIVLFGFYSLHYSKGLTNEKRIVLFNLVFLSGIGFFILKMLK